jgi:hypothetical protein
MRCPHDTYERTLVAMLGAETQQSGKHAGIQASSYGLGEHLGLRTTTLALFRRSSPQSPEV